MSLNNLNKPSYQAFTISEMCRRRLLQPKKLKVSPAYVGLSNKPESIEKEKLVARPETSARARKPKEKRVSPGRPGRPRRFYADTIAMIFEMRQRGMMIKEIAKIFNVTTKNMSNLIIKARNEGFDAFPKRVEK